jgi:hypothetical protein
MTGGVWLILFMLPVAVSFYLQKRWADAKYEADMERVGGCPL